MREVKIDNKKYPPPTYTQSAAGDTTLAQHSSNNGYEGTSTPYSTLSQSQAASTFLPSAHSTGARYSKAEANTSHVGTIAESLHTPRSGVDTVEERNPTKQDPYYNESSDFSPNPPPILSCIMPFSVPPHPQTAPPQPHTQPHTMYVPYQPHTMSPPTEPHTILPQPHTAPPQPNTALPAPQPYTMLPQPHTLPPQAHQTQLLNPWYLDSPPYHSISPSTTISPHFLTNPLQPSTTTPENSNCRPSPKGIDPEESLFQISLHSWILFRISSLQESPNHPLDDFSDSLPSLPPRMEMESMEALIKIKQWKRKVFMKF